VSRATIRALAAAAFLLIALGVCGSSAHAFDGGRYGSVEVIEPPEPARGVVIFFSDRTGITAATEAAALTITKAGAVVVEVDTPSYLNGLDKLDEKCHELVGDAEGLSHRLQRQRKFPDYFTPVVAGIGEGGTVAELALAQAPAVTIEAAVALDPSATVSSRRPICAEASVASGPGGFRYGSPKALSGKWEIGLTSDAAKADRDYVAALLGARAPVGVRDFGSKVNAGEALRAMIESFMAPRSKGGTNLGALPLSILPVPHPSGLMAVVLSGDGGWRDLDKTIAQDLQAQGVPVVGWDSLRYFWSGKTPAQTAKDLAGVLDIYMEKWHANHVALIGYSFGADVLPFAYNRLPEALRSHVAVLALLGLAKSADFEIRVSEFLGESPGPGAPQVAPELSKIPPAMVQCFYGQKEEDTVCPEFEHSGVEVIRTGGGHHFNGDYAALARRILAKLKERSAAH
jgi:type IV secretory pathway VirJ component